MAEEEGRSSVVRLNEIADLLGAISSGSLRESLLRPAELAASCTGNCDCNVRYCTCHGSVSKVARDTLIYPADYQKIREGVVRDLREQLEHFEAG